MALRCVDNLIQEHRLILRAVYVLIAMADQARSGRLPEPDDVEKLLHFFRRFADGHHQAKEEGVLFPALRTAEKSTALRALKQMMFEHEQERSLIEGLENALRTRNHADFAYFARRMGEVLSRHIYKEDNIFFRMVAEVLNTEDDVRLTSEMATYDQLLGEENHDEMAHIVNRLEWKYLGRAA